MVAILKALKCMREVLLCGAAEESEIMSLMR
jgi:hypothetical protein